jgi:2-succinyl-5-enolpyruvyl-6-hydroxy-3-cyclohexene-1-carboxylate synthase
VTAQNLLGEWARLLVESLAAAGVRRAVLSPGSRSTPFAWAALHSERLECDVVIDERSAGFYAVGQAKQTGEPTLLVCTSGTAAANYFPAVIEAALSHTPLVVLTADRPFELTHVAAAQTIDQQKLYGGYCRLFLELGLPDETHGALRALQRMAAQAVHTALFPEPGPVHVNARARKPLEPVAARDAVEIALRDEVTELVARGPTHAAKPRVEPAPDAIAALAAACRCARRGIIVCGPLAAPDSPKRETFAELLEQTGFVAFAETASQLRLTQQEAPAVIDAFDVLLSSARFARTLRPDLVIQLGMPAASIALDRFLGAHSAVERWVLAPHAWPDPQNAARGLVVGELQRTLQGLVVALSAEPPALGAVGQERKAHRERLIQANVAAWRLIDQDVTQARAPLAEALAVRLAVDALPEGGVLALGNSLPIREVDRYCRARARAARVLSQRGTNGIDGVVSSAAGAARASGRPTTLLVGDVSFLHDLGGLWAARHLHSPFVIVVLDNDGGRIFEQLPLAALPGVAPGALDAWLTPHGLDLQRAGQLFALPTWRAETAGELEAALAEAHGRSGASLVIAGVPPHGARELERRLAAQVDAELAQAAEREP